MPRRPGVSNRWRADAKRSCSRRISLVALITLVPPSYQLGEDRSLSRRFSSYPFASDLKIAPNPEELCEQRHELRLFGRKQHASPRKRGRLFANELQQLRFAKADLHEVLVKRVG